MEEQHGYKKPIERGSIDQMIADQRKLKEIQGLVARRSGGWQEFLKESGPALFLEKPAIAIASLRSTYRLRILESATFQHC